MFNKSTFNRALFNRVVEEGTELYVTITSEFGLAPSPIKALVLLKPLTISAESEMIVATIKNSVRLEAVTLGSEFEVLAKLGIKFKIGAATISSEAGVVVYSLRTSETEDLSLEGVNLAPGDTLIIDTETLDVYINGIPNIDSWVTGGSFFKLKAGNNVISFSDNASERNLNVTVLYSDRYL